MLGSPNRCRHLMGRPGVFTLQPHGVLIPSKPGHLAPGVASGERLSALNGVLFAELPGEVLKNLLVSNRPRGGRAALDTGGDKSSDFVHKPFFPHVKNSAIQGLHENLSVSMQTKYEAALLPRAMLRVQAGPKRCAGDFDNFQRSNYASRVLGVDGRGCERILGGQIGQQHLNAFVLEALLQASAHRWISET